MNLLFLGDIVGRPGRDAVCALLPGLIHREQADFVVVNGENASAGAGIKPEHARQLLSAGADVITSGNHIWRHKETAPYIVEEPRLLRPANYPPGTPGGGHLRVKTAGGVSVLVINLMGRIFMEAIDCPFQAVEAILADEAGAADVILVDMHAEATSEKGAMASFLDGRVAAVLGSHTHVQTADERVLAGGTAFHSDAGMCGPEDSVIGVKPELTVRRFRNRMPVRFETAKGVALVQGAVVEVDPESGWALSIRRLQERWEKS